MKKKKLLKFCFLDDFLKNKGEKKGQKDQTTVVNTLRQALFPCCMTIFFLTNLPCKYPIRPSHVFFKH